MKILHIIPYFVRATRTGGPALLLEALARATQTLGHEVTIVTSTGNLDAEIDLDFPGPAWEMLEDGLPTVYLRRKNYVFPSTFYLTPGLQPWLEANLRRFDIVAVHGTWTYFSWIGARMCRKTCTPYLSFPHGSLDPWALRYRNFKKAPYWRLVERAGFEGADGVIALSADEVEQIRAIGIAKPIYIARNGLVYPMPRVEDPDGVIASNWPALAHHPYVYFMSRLHPKKGLEVLLQAWQKVASRQPSWKLVIAGPDEGGYLEKLRRLVTQLGVEQSVLFPGLVAGDTKAALLQAASLFVLPSFSEGVPGAAVEAMAYGLPVLITPGCHLPEVTEHGAGIVVEPAAAAVVLGLERLMTDGALRKTMGTNAAKLAAEAFDESIVAEGMVQFCRTLIKARNVSC